jgi:hypothetical protein
MTEISDSSDSNGLGTPPLASTKPFSFKHFIRKQGQNFSGRMSKVIRTVSDEFVCRAIALGYANGNEVMAFRPNHVVLAIANHDSCLGREFLKLDDVI